jgi:hypothetical protein
VFVCDFSHPLEHRICLQRADKIKYKIITENTSFPDQITIQNSQMALLKLGDFGPDSGGRVRVRKFVLVCEKHFLNFVFISQGSD